MTGRGGGRSGSEILYGIHPVLEALTSRRRSVERILIAREGGGRSLGRLLREAREGGVPVSHVPRAVLQRSVGPRAVHQGIAAVVSPIPYADVEEVCRGAASTPDGVLVVLDGVEDPRNLGAVVRTAAAAGAAGVIVGSGRSPGLTPVVAKASAGALERVAVAREPRLPSRLRSLREAGFRVVALDPRGAAPWDRTPLTGRLAVVAGGEGRGLRSGISGAADARVAIPLAGEVESLNVSVAVAILLYEALRQRRSMRPEGGPRPGSMER